MNIVHKIAGGVTNGWAMESLNDPLALTFSKCVAKVFSWEAVSFSVIGRQNLTQPELLQFSVGGKTDSRPWPDDLLIEHTLSTGSTRGGFWLTEDWIARPGDPALLTHNMPAFFFGSDVQYVSDLSDPRHSPSFRRLFCNRTPLFHGFYIHGPEIPPLRSEAALTQLEGLARSVSTVIFGVYDAESYLVCEPT
jgi:hypothetical protein